MPAKGDRLAAPERREQLLEVARNEFVRYGLAGARMRRIADTAGVNMALLYHYFDSKDAIFEAAVMQPLEEMLANLFDAAGRMAAESTDDRVAEVKAIIAHILRSLHEVGPLLAMVLFSEEESGRRFYAERIHPLLKGSVAPGRQALAGWSQDRVDEDVVTGFFGLCWGVAMDYHLRGAQLDPDRLAESLGNVMLFGIGVPERTPDEHG